MHTIVIKREVYERNPWIARSLHKAFDESLQIAYADLRYRKRRQGDAAVAPGTRGGDRAEPRFGLVGPRPGTQPDGAGNHRPVLLRAGPGPPVWRPEKIMLAEASDSFVL